jgi:hypothetical protein
MELRGEYGDLSERLRFAEKMESVLFSMQTQNMLQMPEMETS